jgi:hypothetical protein
MKKALEEQKARKEEARKEEAINKIKPKKSIADDIEKLKNRREERKKYDEEKKARNEMKLQNENNGGKCDVDFEILIKKKKLSLPNNPENVSKLL